MHANVKQMELVFMDNVTQKVLLRSILYSPTANINLNRIGLCLEPPSSCTSTGGSTCPCDENVRCRYDLACSVTSGQCQICPRGCGVECAAAAKGLELGKDDDVCQVRRFNEFYSFERNHFQFSSL